MSMYLWICVLLSGSVRVYVIEGLGMTIYLSSTSLQVSQCLSCYALYLSSRPATCGAVLHQSWLSLGWNAKPAFLHALWPYASHWASLYLSFLSCKRQIALLHRIGERKKNCPVGALRKHTLPSRWGLPLWQRWVREWSEAAIRQEQASRGVRKRTAAASAALTPGSSTQGYVSALGETTGLQTQPTSCHSGLLQSQHRGEGDRWLSLT